MLRSFSYAAAVARDKATARPACRSRARRRAARAVASARRARRSSTAIARRSRGARVVSGRRRRRARGCSTCSSLEKALYELRYELGNRPDWVAIPARRPCSSSCKSRQTTSDAGAASRTAAPISRLARPAVPARRDLGRRRRQLRAVFASTPKRRAVPVRPQGPARDRSASTCASAPTSSGIATCPRRAPACSTAIACTARTTRSAAIASTRTSCCSIPTRSMIDGPLRWSDAHFGYRVGSRREDLSFDRATAPPACPSAG